MHYESTLEKDFSDAENFKINKKINAESKSKKNSSDQQLNVNQYEDYKENDKKRFYNLPPPSKKVKPRQSRAQRQRIKKETLFEISHLHGHHSNIHSLEVKGKWLITGSQDTSIKLWDLSTGKESHHLHGHSDAVSYLKMVDGVESKKLYNLIIKEEDENWTNEKSNAIDFLFISSSKDCSIKIWTLPSGICLKSIYTFSPISTFLLVRNVVFAGSDHGKLTAFSLINGAQLCDTLIHDDEITALKWNEKYLLTTSVDGDLKFWKIPSFENHSDIIENEIELELKKSWIDSGSRLEKSPILNAFFYQDKVLFGDNKGIIYFTDYTLEELSSSVITRDKSTRVDSFCLLDHQLILATFNIKTQEQRLHVYDVEDNLSYLTSFSHPSLTRISCCCAYRSSHGVFLVTGGSKLLEWKKSSLLSSTKKASGDAQDSFVVVGQPAAGMTDGVVSSDAESRDFTDDDLAVADQFTDDDSTSEPKLQESNTTWWCALF